MILGFIVVVCDMSYVAHGFSSDVLSSRVWLTEDSLDEVGHCTVSVVDIQVEPPEEDPHSFFTLSLV